MTFLNGKLFANEQLPFKKKITDIEVVIFYELPFANVQLLVEKQLAFHEQLLLEKLDVEWLAIKELVTNEQLVLNEELDAIERLLLMRTSCRWATCY